MASADRLGRDIAVEQTGSPPSTISERPPDGFYLAVTIPYEGDRASQWRQAEAVAAAARVAGFTEAAAHPKPSAPKVCFGRPCDGLLFPSGQRVVVILQGYPGSPDVGTPGGEAAFLQFQSTHQPQALQLAAERGFPSAAFEYIAFSSLDVDGTWEPD